MDDRLLDLISLLGPHATVFLALLPINAFANALLKLTIGRRWPVETWPAWAQALLIVSDFLAINTTPATTQIKEARLRATSTPQPKSPWHEDPNDGDGL